MGGYTLGLDIGSNSIGWALLNIGEKPGIVDMGVRVFPEGVDRDTGGLEKSKNATRREARGARRTHQRRSLRKERLLSTLQAVGLLPRDESELRSVFHSNPYQLRKKGLDEKLDLYQFGRVLYHLSQRRGFKSNRKSGKAKEDGVVIKGANALQTEMGNARCRTIGEYFAGLNPDEQRIRGKYTFRTMYEHEFDLLWAKQEETYRDILCEDLRKGIRDEIIFFQRPVTWDPKTIGDCELEPGEKRCPRGDWYARRFRLLQDVNNLKIQNPDGSEVPLTKEQREFVLGELSQKKELTFDKIREKLGLIETQGFNLEQDGKVKALKGDAFAASMRSKNTFGPKNWDEMDEQKKVKLNEAFVDLEDDKLTEELKTEYGLSDEQTETAMKVSLPQGYMSCSRKAIKKLLPVMENGKRTDEAIRDVYGEKRTRGGEEALAKLGMPPELRNPIVNKALFEVRKVINAIVREYGKPAKIKIEMARDVQGSSRQREELHWKMLENERRNEDVRTRLKDIGISKPTRDDVIKYKLWEECDRRCPYTGKSISQQSLFGENPEFQVEHILPYDRSLDDSYMNKTLCEVHENIHVKRIQTPFEAYNHDPTKYEQIKQNIKALPWPKRQKFLQQEINLDTHISRELNDTRYICREVVGYLKQLGVNVRGTRGKITAELRHQWGLDGIFDELGVRRDDDHRRHAVDAVVVGVTDNEHLRQLARSKYAMSGAQFEPPWDNFREEVREKVNKINVSHRVCRKTSGKLHEETNYGPTGKEGLYVFRKELKQLTLPMVDKIVDPIVWEVVRSRLMEKRINPDGWDGKTPKEKWMEELRRRREEQHGKKKEKVGNSRKNAIPKEIWKEPLYMRTTKSDKNVPIKKVRVYNVADNVIAMKDPSGQIYRYVEPGSNHHIEIFEYTDTKGRVKRDGKVVTMFEAVQRSQRGEPAVKRDYKDGKKFVCSLSINDMVMMKNKSGETDLYRVQKMDANKMVRFRHHTASRIERKETYIDKTGHLFEGYKITVDPIGRIHPAND